MAKRLCLLFRFGSLLMWRRRGSQVCLLPLLRTGSLLRLQWVLMLLLSQLSHPQEWHRQALWGREALQVRMPGLAWARAFAEQVSEVAPLAAAQGRDAFRLLVLKVSFPVCACWQVWEWLQAILRCQRVRSPVRGQYGFRRRLRRLLRLCRQPRRLRT